MRVTRSCGGNMMPQLDEVETAQHHLKTELDVLDLNCTQEFTSTVEKYRKKHRGPLTYLLVKVLKHLMPDVMPKKVKEITSAEQFAQQAEHTRQNLKNIGATPVTIHTSDHAVLDGAYIPVDALLHKLKEAGGQRFSIQVDDETSVSGFVLPASNAQVLVKSFEELRGLLSTTIGEGDEAKTYFYSTGSQFPNPLPSSVTLSEIDLTPKSRGTVMLTLAAKSTYEANKREIMAFLERGLNIMVFNYREYGKSKGIINDVSLKRDMDAAYDYLEKVHHIKPQDLMLKSLCLSGDAGTYLAAKHAGVNLFLDQSYADIRQFVTHVVRDKMKPGVKADLAGWLVQHVVPTWIVKKHIAKVQGRIALLATRDDADVLQSETLENLQPLLDREDGHSRVTLYTMPGSHVDSWMDAEFSEPSLDYVRIRRSLEYVPDLIKESTLDEETQEALWNMIVAAKNQPPSIPDLQALVNYCRELSKHATGFSTRQLLLTLTNEADEIASRVRKGYQFEEVKSPGHLIVNQYLKRLGFYQPICD